MGPENHTWYLFLRATSDLESLNDIEFVGITHWPNHCPEVPQITHLWFTLGMMILRADSCHYPGHSLAESKRKWANVYEVPAVVTFTACARALRKYTCTWLGREQEIALSMVWVTWPTDLFKKTNEWTRASSQSLTAGSVFRTRILSTKRLPSRHRALCGALSLSLLSTRLRLPRLTFLCLKRVTFYSLCVCVHAISEAPFRFPGKICTEWQHEWLCVHSAAAASMALVF